MPFDDSLQIRLLFLEGFNGSRLLVDFALVLTNLSLSDLLSEFLLASWTTVGVVEKIKGFLVSLNVGFEFVEEVRN